MHRPARITFCITELDPGGAERQLVRLAAGLDRELFDPDVVCLSGRGELAGDLATAAVPVTFLNACGRFDAGVVLRLSAHFRRRRPDLVQTFLFHANLAGRIAARMARVPAVVSGIRVAERGRNWHRALDRWTDWLVDRHVCVSRAVAEFAAATGLPESKLIVIPNAVDVDRFALASPADLGELGIPATAPIVLFIGRLVEQKDPMLLLEAFRIVVALRPDAHLVLTGEGPLKTSLESASHGIRTQVHLTGRRDDVPNLLRAASCLVLPSRWEGMPNVLLEAMAAGTPVVSTQVEGSTELLHNGQYGEIVFDRSPVELAALIEKVLASPDGAKERALSSQRHAASLFTSEKMIAAYQDLYSSLTESRSSSRGSASCPAGSRRH